jgi:hypothetical protein
MDRRDPVYKNVLIYIAFIKTEAANQSIVCFVIAIHGNWISAIHAGMTAHGVVVIAIHLMTRLHF